MKLSILLVDVSHDFTLGVEELSNWTQLPVGLLWLASSLRQRFPDEVTVRVLDVATEPGHLDAVEAALRELAPRLVGIRALSPTAGQFHRVARLVKRVHPEALVIGGGPYAHSSATALLDDPNVDAVCPAEGELVLGEVVARLLAGSADLREVAGLDCRHEGQVHHGAPAPAIRDLDTLPFPDYRDLDIHRYVGKHPHTAVARPYASLLCSRGCPYKCIFCHSIFGRVVRMRSPENVVAEVRALHEQHGIRDFIVADDAFNVNLAWAKSVLRGIHGLRISPRIFFANGLRGDIWDEEYLDLMAEVGVVEVVYAVESASARIQEMLRKRLDLPAVERAIVETARRGIIVNGFFMIGYPSETRAELGQTVEFITRHLEHLDFPYLSVVRAFKGTALYDLAKSFGYDEEFLRNHAAMPYGMQVRTQSAYNFLPNELLGWARMEVALRLYSPPRMKRVLARMRRSFLEEEIAMKLANCTGASQAQAQGVVRRYDSGVFDVAPAARSKPPAA